jgi:hypothetical protein
MKKKKERRNPLDKERWLEGNRQKWALFLFVVGLFTLGLTSFGFIHDPAPFLGYFSGIGITFILGASADSFMKIFKIDSTTQNNHQHTEVNTNSHSESYSKQELFEYKEYITIEGEDDAPEVKPYSQKATEND